jgi:hypothetical protein
MSEKIESIILSSDEEEIEQYGNEKNYDLIKILI